MISPSQTAKTARSLHQRSPATSHAPAGWQTYLRTAIKAGRQKQRTQALQRTALMMIWLPRIISGMA